MKGEILHCPRCGEVMLYDRDKDFWQCPRCGGEFWEDGSKLAMLREEERARIDRERERQRILWSIGRPVADVLPPVAVWVKGKGSRKAGKRRRKAIKRIPWWQRAWA